MITILLFPLYLLAIYLAWVCFVSFVFFLIYKVVGDEVNHDIGAALLGAWTVVTGLAFVLLLIKRDEQP